MVEFMLSHTSHQGAAWPTFMLFSISLLKLFVPKAALWGDPFELRLAGIPDWFHSYYVQTSS